ncbi:hypothetical protein ABZS77_10660 [Micromonospora sp. NPDC005298]|uniref:hypothetical protein n=1 Tax=Micromonospora sp. NPDC005298 TaxID=3156873 RepID=UPI0033B630C0
MDDVRRLLGDDLARHPAPPLGDLVQQAMAQGRRLRRRRRLARLGGGSTLVLLLVIGLAVGPFDPIGAVPGDAGPGHAGPPGGPGLGPPDGPVGTPSGPLPPMAPGGVESQHQLRWSEAPANATRVLGTVTIRRKPVGETRTASPEGALELLTRLLPKGRTSDYAVLPGDGASPGMPFVQLRLDRGKGPGVLRFSIYQDDLGAGPAPGTVELTEMPDDCVAAKRVTVHHYAGLQIDVLISSCLAGDGIGSPAAVPALSVEEAVEIASNPLWGTELPADIVAAGTKRFSTLDRSNG